MNWFLGLLIVAAVVVYKRSTEIITINPMTRVPPETRVRRSENAPEAADFRSIIGAVQQIAQQQSAGNQNQRGRAVIRAMVQQGKLLEAIELYRRVYGVDGLAAKRAIDQMVLEQ